MMMMMTTTTTMTMMRGSRRSRRRRRKRCHHNVLVRIIIAFMIVLINCSLKYILPWFTNIQFPVTSTQEPRAMDRTTNGVGSLYIMNWFSFSVLPSPTRMTPWFHVTQKYRYSSALSGLQKWKRTYIQNVMQYSLVVLGPITVCMVQPLGTRTVIILLLEYR